MIAAFLSNLAVLAEKSKMFMGFFAVKGKGMDLSQSKISLADKLKRGFLPVNIMMTTMMRKMMTMMMKMMILSLRAQPCPG